MTQELAQAIRDLATTGRLSEASEEAISAILDPEPEESEDEDTAKTSSTSKATTTTGGKTR